MPLPFLRRALAPSHNPQGSDAWRLLIQLAVLSLIVVSVLGAVMTWRINTALRRSAIQEASQETQGDLAPRLARQLREEDLARPMTGQRYAQFQRLLEESVLSEHTLRVRLWSRDGTVLYSDDPSEVGASRPVESDLGEALAGGTAAHLGTEDTPELASERQVLEVYAPLVLPGSGEIVGALEIYEDATHLAQLLSTIRYHILVGLGSSLGAYSVVVFLVAHRSVRTIRRQQQEIETRAHDTVRAVVAALDLRDTDTEHHATRVAEIAIAIGRHLKLTPAQLSELEVGALLHDVGKIGVPDRILRKPGPLTEEEWEAMRRHPDLGYHMLSRFPNLHTAALLVRAHHEHFDGTGYSLGLAGPAIPLPARIFAVADAYDAITSNRPYRATRSHEEALAEIRRCAGSQFDPKVARAFLDIADRFSRPPGELQPMKQIDKDAGDTVLRQTA